jgi:uncharacterized coiled-coil protein SlyX
VSNVDDLEHRVASLEHQVGRLREQAALAVSEASAARLLAGGADHDVSVAQNELRAHIRALNALRETQLEQGQAITSLDQKVTSLDQKVTEQSRAITSLDQKVAEGFATLGAGMAQITALLTRGSDSGQD